MAGKKRPTAAAAVTAPAVTATAMVTPTRTRTRQSKSATRALAAPPLPLLSPPLGPAPPVLSPIPKRRRTSARSTSKDGTRPSLVTLLDEAMARAGTLEPFLDGTVVRKPSAKTTTTATGSDTPSSPAIAHPDPHIPAPYHGRVHVLCGDDAHPYDATLLRATVHQNQSEFVVVQALVCPEDETFLVWTRQGHVGTQGTSAMSGPWTKCEEAIEHFTATFRAKTLVQWTARRQMPFQEGRFSYVEIEHCVTGDKSSGGVSSTRKRRRAKTTVPVPLELVVQQEDLPENATAPPSRLDVQVQAFLTMIATAANLLPASDLPSSSSDKTIRVALPLGRLARATIDKGYDALQQIYEALQIRADRTTLQHLSSRFYSTIPTSAALEPIDSMVKLAVMAERMAAICVALERREAISLDFMEQCFSQHYLDECYNSLECRLFPLLPTSREYGLVESYIFNSCCCFGTPSGSNRKNTEGKVIHIFRVEKPSEASRFEPYRRCNNRRVLWHGSRMSNWLGILREGLLITPPGVPLNGSSFGAGLYFTDKISKAMSYSHSGRQGDQHQVFLLSEVALGDSKIVHSGGSRTVRASNNKSTTHHSCHGLGRCVPDAAGDYEDAFGAIWPLGKATPTKDTGATLPHSEYVVYNPAQARMRYIVVTNGLSYY